MVLAAAIPAIIPLSRHVHVERPTAFGGSCHFNLEGQQSLASPVNPQGDEISPSRQPPPSSPVGSASPGVVLLPKTAERLARPIFDAPPLQRSDIFDATYRGNTVERSGAVRRIEVKNWRTRRFAGGSLARVYYGSFVAVFPDRRSALAPLRMATQSRCAVGSRRTIGAASGSLTPSFSDRKGNRSLAEGSYRKRSRVCRLRATQAPLLM